MFRSYIAAALRNLARNRVYGAVTIAGLAIGLAAAMLIALFVRDEYSYDRFFPGYRQVYRVSETIQVPGERPIISDVTPVRVGPALPVATTVCGSTPFQSLKSPSTLIVRCAIRLTCRSSLSSDFPTAPAS